MLAVKHWGGWYGILLGFPGDIQISYLQRFEFWCFLGMFLENTKPQQVVGMSRECRLSLTITSYINYIEKSGEDDESSLCTININKHKYMYIIYINTHTHTLLCKLPRKYNTSMKTVSHPPQQKLHLPIDAPMIMDSAQLILRSQVSGVVHLRRVVSDTVVGETDLPFLMRNSSGTSMSLPC